MRRGVTEMFPVIPEDLPAQTAESIGRVPAFDSGSSCFLLTDGALLERTGRPAVRQWIDLMLRQQIDRVPIYTTEEGAPKIGIGRDMIGSKLPSGLITAELERNVRETLYYCPAIRTVRDLSVTRRGRACHVEFTAVLYDGGMMEVSEDV